MKNPARCTTKHIRCPMFSGERVIEGSTPKRVWLDHFERYKFASQFVEKMNVLDISCGTGYGSKLLRDAGAEKVIGVDISTEAIQFARSYYQNDGIHFEVGDILGIKFPENYFDIVTCFETIEHVQAQEIAIKELNRVLKPDGVLIISSPNRKLVSPEKSVDDPPINTFHTKEYTRKEFISFVENYFNVLKIYGQRGIYKLFLISILEKAMRRILPRIYNPDKGNSALREVSLYKEYRYIILLCKKIKNNSITYEN